MRNAAFELALPAGAGGPVVVAVPHAGVCVPDEDRETLLGSERGRLRDADLLVDRLFHAAPSAGAALLVGTVSRHVLDLNRAPHDIDDDVCAELGRSLSTPRSLLWRLATDGTKVLARRLSPDEVASRLERVFWPYHDALWALLDERRRRFGYAVLLDAHSMPSRPRAGTGPIAESVLSDVFGTTCAARLVDVVEERLCGLGLEVARNAPYAGGYAVRRYGRPEEGLHALQLEVRRDLYLDEERLTWDDERGGALADALGALLEDLATLAL